MSPDWHCQSHDKENVEMIDFTLVIPCLNEGKATSNLCNILLKLANSSKVKLEIIVVNDGSNEETSRTLQSIAKSDKVIILDNLLNVGKGYSLRRGIAESKGHIVGYLDSDGEIDIANIFTYYEFLSRNSHVFALVGSKTHVESNISYPPLRSLMSKGFHFLVWLTFSIPLKDTQTGFKLFQGTELRNINRKCISNRYIFDVEVIYYALKEGKILEEIPVNIIHKLSSTINVRSIILMIWDLFTLRIKLALDK